VAPRPPKEKLRILITAGPTREKIDPVRFISNYSTGTFGYEIAKAAYARGASVVLISGPVSMPAPRGVKVIRVESASEMERAAFKEFPRCDCLIMAAAVSDWRVKTKARTKIKKGSYGMTLKLVENPDILKGLGGRRRKGQMVVGFALETGNLRRSAIKKLKEKKLDMIVANRLSPERSVFGDRVLDVLIIDSSLRERIFFGKTKKELAKSILDNVFNHNI
jgi:phosphopantothenoylcysteine decarboxylase/phosphopantothenate--cysteine ligase